MDALIERYRIDYGIDAMEGEQAAIKEGINKYVLTKKNYDDGKIKLTRVQAHRRAWNVDKLEKILPHAIFRKVIKIEVDKTKLDELVKKGTISADRIDPAFEETPNAPSVKWTRTNTNDGKAQASAIADALS